MKKNIEPFLLQLVTLLKQLSDTAYNAPCSLLNKSSIGSHTRHIIELFQCLLDGYHSGTVNYDNRKRDKKIETDRILACELLNGISHQMEKPNKPLILVSKVHEEDELIIDSNFYREALYNMEHTIHHMALIRVGIQEVCDIALSECFGVAPSTIKYKKTCVQ